AKGTSFFQLARSLLLPPTLDTIFLYPKVRGFGNFCERLATAITAMGGTILTGTTVDGINGVTRKSRFNDDYAGFSHLVWTGNLHDLGRLLDEKFPHLEYLSTIF